MKTKKIASVFAVLVASSAMGLAADTYKIDPAHSSANFSVKHMMISTVRGRFSDVSGTVEFDEKDPSKSSVQAVIKAASINTDNANRDKHLNSPDFFDTQKFPEIRFQSTSVQKTGEGQYVVTGNLTIKDVTKQVQIPMTVATGAGMKPGEQRMGAEGHLTIQRYDYHVSYDPTGKGVSNDVNIDLNVEAVKQ